jgi:type IV pilus assembly protein PilO
MLRRRIGRDQATQASGPGHEPETVRYQLSEKTDARRANKGRKEMKNTEKSAKAISPIMEKIEKLSKPQRIAIYSVSLVLLMALAGLFLIKPKFADIDQLEGQLSQIQIQLEKAKKNARELNDWRNQMKKKEAEYATVMRALPEKEEIPSLLAGISQAGNDAGLEFLLFQPKPESAKDFYAEIPVDINISGSYHQVAVFFDKVANLPRIVNIRGIKMVPLSKAKGSHDLSTVCQAVTYKFVETAPKGKKPPKRGK